MPALSRASRLLLGCYLGLAVLELLASTVPGRAGRWADGVCLVLLMPLLAGFLLVTRVGADRLTRWVLVALGFSWLGDTVGGVTLLAKIGLFVVAQLGYSVAFWPHRRRSLAARPVALAVFAVGLGMLIVLVGRAAGSLWPAVVGYGLALGTMAVLASGLGRTGAIGGVLFLVSDLSLGLTVFLAPGGMLGPALDLLVMPTYLLAQLLLVLAVLARQERPRVPAPGLAGSVR